MRWVICAGVLLMLAPRAYAGDFDVLRGPEPAVHWGGFYGGVQGGYSSSVVNFGPAAGPDIGFILRETSIEQDEQISQWPVLNGDGHPQSTSFGAFIGYNFEWQDLVLGTEVDYFRVSLSAASTGRLTINFTDSGNLPAGHHYFYTLTAAGQASFSMSDIVTFRARAGWETGNFLPYFFGGLALGRANVASAASVAYRATDFPDSQNPPLTPLNDLCFNAPATPTQASCLTPAGVASASTTGAIAYGADMGLGVDVALLPHVFVRGELEYIYFAPISGIHASLSSARVGVGYKF
jgi:opacity protein-like surface antigen